MAFFSAVTVKQVAWLAKMKTAFILITLTPIRNLKFSNVIDVMRRIWGATVEKNALQIDCMCYNVFVQRVILNPLHPINRHQKIRDGGHLAAVSPIKACGFIFLSTSH